MNPGDWEGKVLITPIGKSDFKAKVIYGSYKGGIIEKYMNFCRVYDMQRNIHKNDMEPQKGIAETVDICIEKKILDAIETADLDPNQQEKLEHEFEKEIYILSAKPRLRAIAKDFVGHYSNLWTTGKAMFVCLNKVTAVKMYNFVQEYWQEEMKILETAVKNASSDQEQQELLLKLKWMKDTEMCVVISQEQNEIQTFKKWGLDIKPHREKMEKRELDKEYKDPESNFRVVFVCAMWLTGFDVKTLSCLYLDKPMKAHTLMQTIAIANRVAAGKSNGLIIDYIGIVKALEKALNDYTRNKKGNRSTMPTVDKGELIKKIIEAISGAKRLLADHDYDLEKLIAAQRLQKLQLIADGAEAMSSSLETKRMFTTYAGEINRLMKYLNRDDIQNETRAEVDAILAILRQINNKRKHVDNKDLMVEINHIINENIEIDHEDGTVSKQFDISNIDFDLLAAEFAKVKRKNLLIRDCQWSC